MNTFWTFYTIGLVANLFAFFYETHIIKGKFNYFSYLFFLFIAFIPYFNVGVIVARTYYFIAKSLVSFFSGDFDQNEIYKK